MNANDLGAPDCRSVSRQWPEHLTNGFSKKLENPEPTVGLFIAGYNLCRAHSSLKTTLAVALGVTDHPWSIAELIDVAAAADDEGRPFTPLPPTSPPAPLPAPAPMPTLARERPRFTVIQGGRQ